MFKITGIGETNVVYALSLEGLNRTQPVQQRIKLPDKALVAPLSAVLRSEEVLAANFDYVFVGVVLNRRRVGMGHGVARSRPRTHNGTASMAIDVDTSSLCFRYGCDCNA